MITLHEAQSLIDKAVKPLIPVAMAVNDTAGCIIASGVASPIDVPGFANSKMDGIALRFNDLTGDKPWRLPLQATIAAGDRSGRELMPGHAVKIMTGAPMPDGADTVVKVEDVVFEGEGVIISENVNAGQFVRPVGDDIKAGEMIFNTGDILTAVDTGILASIGLEKVKIVPRPKIAVLCTGSELVKPGMPLQPGRIYDSNQTVLRSLLEKSGFPAMRIISMVPDDKQTLAEAIKNIIGDVDLLITTGGVSMGDYDYIPEVVRLLGGDILFHKARVKPGKPVLVASWDNRWIIGLPGNPVSVVACYHLYVRRAIARLMGQDFQPRSGRVVLQNNVEVHGNRFCLVGASLCDAADQVLAFPSVRQDSGRLSSIKGINGFIMMDENTRKLSKGDSAEAEWLY